MSTIRLLSFNNNFEKIDSKTDHEIRKNRKCNIYKSINGLITSWLFFNRIFLAA